MSEDLTQLQLPLPPSGGGWKAWAAWGGSALAMVGLRPAAMFLLSKFRERKDHRVDVLRRLEELDKSCLKKGEFELKMANLFEAVNQGRQEQRSGIDRVENRIDYISARFDAHIDDRPFQAPGARS